MNLRFYIDPETGEPHCYRHGVDEDEVEVEDVLRSEVEDRAGRGDTRVAIGQTREGRYLRVIYKRDLEPGNAFVITAFDVTGKPLAAFRRRMRRRNR